MHVAWCNTMFCIIESCGSSVVEHSLGKGEVESSILSRSTSKISKFFNIRRMAWVFI